jgi:hypothetical protein
MIFSTTRKKVNQVFTPRRNEVNNLMYVDRPTLEKALRRAIDGSQHVVLYGESGNGKSWLYKKVFLDEVRYVTANCANANRLSSLTKEIELVAFPGGSPVKTGYKETKGAEIGAAFLGANVSHEGSYSYSATEPLLGAFSKLYKDAGGKQTILVLENLESIFCNKERMDELADILLLLDDPRYAALKIKFLIVGTPAGVLEYFTKTKNMESVSNRIIELEKVSGFDGDQVKDLVRKGFVSELGVIIPDEDVEVLAKRIFYVTMGVAQRVHEYCEQLGYKIEDNGWKYENALRRRAEHAWLTGGLRQSYSVLEASLNSRDTAVARRNQVIYSIGQLRTHQFYSNGIESIIAREFPDTIPQTNMGIGSILTELSKGDDALLVRNEKTGQYRVKDPRYTMCIRAALYIHPTTRKVTKRNFKSG